MSLTFALALTILVDLRGPRRAQLLRSRTGVTFEPALARSLDDLKRAAEDPPEEAPDDSLGQADRRFSELGSTIDRQIETHLTHPDCSETERAGLTKVRSVLQPAALTRLRRVEKAALRFTLPLRVASIRPELELFRSPEPQCLPALVEVQACEVLADRFQERTLTTSPRPRRGLPARGAQRGGQAAQAPPGRSGDRGRHQPGSGARLRRAPVRVHGRPPEAASPGEREGHGEPAARHYAARGR